MLEKFAQSFPQYCHLIVWSRDTYELFLRDMRKYGITIKRHRVVVLQDVLRVIAGSGNNQIGFENALISSGIEYVPNYLHYAKHDANYLYQLFYQCIQQYSGMTATENCLANDATRMLHTESNIEKICKWFQLSYSVSSNAVFVRTAFSRWIVYLQEDKVKELFHENYRTNKSQYFKKQKMKCTEGYHKQKLPSENFFEVIQYIKYHDAGTVKRMSKKSRLEKLLEMVEMELKMKNTEEKDYGYDNMPELRRTNIG